MNIDWQKYADGLLDPAEMRKADEILRTDDRARKELEGLRSFRKMVRVAALSEPVPHSRLRQILKSVIGKSQSAVWRRTAAFATLGVGAAAMAFLAFNFFSGQTDPGAEVRKTFTSETKAQKWASGVSGVELPTLQLSSLGSFDSVHCSTGWACFDYYFEGYLIHIYMKMDNVAEGCEVVQRGEQTFFVDDAISFDEKGLTVSVQGGTEDVRWNVVDYVSSNPDAIY